MRENYTLARLYVEDGLHTNAQIIISGNAYLHIIKVLRKKRGDSLRLFNGRDGEWSAMIDNIDKRQAVLTTQKHLRKQTNTPDIELLFAPLKKERTRILAEKACELGVKTLRPVITARTQHTLKTDKIKAYIISAAEQTERLDLPEILPVQKLPDLLNNWQSRPLVFADEAGGEKAIKIMADTQEPISILIGPEGGFDDKERKILHAKPFVKPITLGPRILRADTAAISALALWQSVSGDW